MPYYLVSSTKEAHVYGKDEFEGDIIKINSKKYKVHLEDEKLFLKDVNFEEKF